ncbi:MAG TPA: FHA domain-containing protein [Myxococcaceae bacterium]|nr:FHA domain-containing protein [Myxococcaceae bacterium]
MVRSVLLSVLVRQHLSLKKEFRKRYPHAWLVWEAGAWSISGDGEQNVAHTQPPAEDLQDCLPTGDVLCFELATTSAEQVLRLGRASQNDIVINDATVSREHLLVIRHASGDWSAELKSPTQHVAISGRTLAHGKQMPLRHGDVLKVGEVLLTFYDPRSFELRIESEAEKLMASVPTT